MTTEPKATTASDCAEDGETIAAMLRFLKHGGPTEMDCRELLDVIAHYVDLESGGRTGEAEDELPGVHPHLEDCDHCQELHAVLLKLCQGGPCLDQDLEQVWGEIRERAGGEA